MRTRSGSDRQARSKSGTQTARVRVTLYQSTDLRSVGIFVGELLTHRSDKGFGDQRLRSAVHHDNVAVFEVLGADDPVDVFQADPVTVIRNEFACSLASSGVGNSNARICSPLADSSIPVTENNPEKRNLFSPWLSTFIPAPSSLPKENRTKPQVRYRYYHLKRRLQLLRTLQGQLKQNDATSPLPSVHTSRYALGGKYWLDTRCAEGGVNPQTLYWRAYVPENEPVASTRPRIAAVIAAASASTGSSSCSESA